MIKEKRRKTKKNLPYLALCLKLPAKTSQVSFLLKQLQLLELLPQLYQMGEQMPDEKNPVVTSQWTFLISPHCYILNIPSLLRKRKPDVPPSSSSASATAHLLGKRGPGGWRICPSCSIKCPIITRQPFITAEDFKTDTSCFSRGPICHRAPCDPAAKSAPTGAGEAAPPLEG